jgi:hypothetical protein
MIPYSNIYAQKVFEILAPLIGDMMAQGVINVQLKSIGKNESNLDKEDMPKLAEKIGQGLVVFLGSDTASKVCNRIAQIF